MSLDLSVLWITFCTFLVYSMQFGFLFLESGLVRRKNNSSVAFKNLVDFFFGFFAFLVIGYSVYSGKSFMGLWGEPYLVDFSSLPSIDLAKFLYMAGFATATGTIISGAIAERIRSSVYCILILTISLFCFPIIAHWVWNSNGFLASWGFVDLAGGAVVHSVGGMAAFTILLLLGPRQGVDLKNNLRPSPSNNVEVVYGGFLLIVCWMGFNAGAENLPNKNAMLIILNTLASACGGFCIAYAFNLSNNKKSIPEIVNGALSGVVAITSCAHISNLFSAIVIGGVAALIVIYGEKLIAKKLDDVAGAVAVHLLGGSVGILAVPFLNYSLKEATIRSTLYSMGVQLLGLSLILAWVFIIIYLSLIVIKRISPLRITALQEEEGLNYEEFGITDELSELLREMNEQISSKDFTKPVKEEQFTVIGNISKKYNEVTSLICKLFEERKVLEQNLVHASTLSATGEMASGLAHEINNPLGIIKLSVAALKKYLSRKNLDDEFITELTEDINGTVDRISEITVGLRNISRDPTAEEESIFSVDELFKDTMCIAKEKCSQNNVDLKFDFLKEERNILLKGNRVQISQAMVNIFNNAYDAISENKEKWIRFILQKEDQFIKIRLIDSGTGISEEVLSKIFNPFFTTKEIGKGTGIGLSISKKMLEKSGGELLYELFEGNTSFVLRVKKSL